MRRMISMTILAMTVLPAAWPAAAQTDTNAIVVKVDKMATPEKLLRFEVTVPASIDEVWNAFATRAGAITWLWSDVRIDLRPGGDWLVLYPGGATGGGTIVSFVPKRQLVVRALAPEQFPTVRTERTNATFEFEPVVPRSTKVTLVQTGWKNGKEWDDAYEYLARGNAQLLATLKRRFETGPINWQK
jgi:uncharacterized protein YndB with AHSA1/START domain